LISVFISKKWQSFSQNAQPRSGSFTVSWMWAIPLSSTVIEILAGAPPY
jgi:hypothetical protein